MSLAIASAETPVPVIDLDRVERNLTKMQAYCDLHGLALRPHIKTHKIPAFAHRQMALGAVGITCQKLGEAEMMVEAGLDNILISYPLIGPAKAMRLARLAQQARMQVAIDNPVALETAAKAALSAGAEIGVLIEFDSGAKRTGVTSVDEVLALAQRVVAASGLRFDGLMTYPILSATAPFIASARAALTSINLAPAVISGGGTPNAWRAHETAGLTELRVGTYIYHDRATVGSGAASLEDCALHVHATIISRPTKDRAILDCGTKSLTSDPVAPEVGRGYGLILEYPDAVIERLNEEHGMVDLSGCTRQPEIGERVRVLPNHVCVVSNLHNRVLAMQNGKIVDTLTIAARGLTV